MTVKFLPAPGVRNRKFLPAPNNNFKNFLFGTKLHFPKILFGSQRVNNSRRYWQSVNSLLGEKKTRATPAFLVKTYQDYMDQKINDTIVHMNELLQHRYVDDSHLHSCISTVSRSVTRKCNTKVAYHILYWRHIPLDGLQSTQAQSSEIRIPLVLPSLSPITH